MASIYHFFENQGTFVLKTGPGVVESIFYDNGNGGNFADNMILYDGNPSANRVIMKMAFTPRINELFTIPLPFTFGLTAVMSSGCAAAVTLTEV